MSGLLATTQAAELQNTFGSLIVNLMEYDPDSLQSYEDTCTATQEARTAVHRILAQLCAIGVDARAAKVSASLFGQKEDWIRRMAEVWEAWGLEDILPHVPLNLYEVAAQQENPKEALALALDNDWSARQLQDHYDAEKGQKISRVTVLKDMADLTVTDAGILVKPHDRIPGVDFPAVGEVTIRGVIG